MEEVKVIIPQEQAYSYPIHIGSGLLTNLPSWLPTHYDHYIIISDEIVDRLYGDQLTQALKAVRGKVLRLSFPAGESSKCYEIKQQLEDKMFASSCNRNSVILALGGGVTGDLSGFIAATYMRGIDYIQLPTTLLAMVDSSVGGKTAIDNTYGKNLIGAFWQPKCVVSDISCLSTLSEAQRLSGLIEALKMFLSHDKQSLDLFLRNDKHSLLYDESLITQIITQAVTIKAKVVACDQREQHGERALLNFGHTIAHAIEKVVDYQMLHGDAVALGLLVEVRIARILKLLSLQDCNLIEDLLNRLGYNRAHLTAYDVEQVISMTLIDKKNKTGQVHYVLIERIGQMFVKDGAYTHPVDNAIVKAAFSN